jgi:hypothetical protein
MPDSVADAESTPDLEGEQTHPGVGALLALLKQRLDPAAFAHVAKAIPNSDDQLAAIESKLPAGAGSLLNTVKEMAGKLLGGGEADHAAAVEGHFASFGVPPEALKTLLPKLHAMLADKLPPQVLEQIQQHVPGFGPPPG